jgi:2-dehydropantoate 2-reductase
VFAADLLVETPVASEPREGRSTTQRLGSDAIRIGQARGYKLEEIDHLPPETIARAGAGDAAALKTYDERRSSRVGRGSPDQRPSMGQDMAKGRRTEIEFLNGFVVREGEQVGRPAPMSGSSTSSKRSSVVN